MEKREEFVCFSASVVRRRRGGIESAECGRGFANAKQAAWRHLPPLARATPEQSILCAVVAGELETFVARQRKRDRPVLGFVEHDSQSFLGCGVLEYGFLRPWWGQGVYTTQGPVSRIACGPASGLVWQLWEKRFMLTLRGTQLAKAYLEVTRCVAWEPRFLQ
jgi:hypothetical protein